MSSWYTVNIDLLTDPNIWKGYIPSELNNIKGLDSSWNGFRATSFQYLFENEYQIYNNDKCSCYGHLFHRYSCKQIKYCTEKTPENWTQYFNYSSDNYFVRFRQHLLISKITIWDHPKNAKNILSQCSIP